MRSLIFTNKRKAIPIQAWRGPEVSRRLRLPHFKTRESGKVVSPTHRPPLPPGNIPSTHFCYMLSQLQGHTAAGRFMSMKILNNNFGNRTRDLPTCSAVPQPTAPPRAPTFTTANTN